MRDKEIEVVENEFKPKSIKDIQIFLKFAKLY